MNKRSELINQWLERYYSYIGLGLVSCIALIMLQYFIFPQYQRMLSAGLLQYQDTTSVLAERTAYLQDLKMMEADYQQLDQRVIRAIAIAFPVTYSDGPVFAEMEQLLAGSKFTLQTVNVSTPVASPTEPALAYEPVVVSVNLSAVSGSVTYADFKALLQTFERSPHILNLESLTYSAGTTSYTFVFETYQRIHTP